jgi:hypothetical protein
MSSNEQYAITIFNKTTKKLRFALYLASPFKNKGYAKINDARNEPLLLMLNGSHVRRCGAELFCC